MVVAMAPCQKRRPILHHILKYSITRYKYSGKGGNEMSYQIVLEICSSQECYFNLVVERQLADRHEYSTTSGCGGTRK